MPLDLWNTETDLKKYSTTGTFTGALKAGAGYSPWLLISPKDLSVLPGPTPTPPKYSSFSNEEPNTDTHPLLEFQRNQREALKHIRAKLDIDQSQSYGL